LGQRPSATAEAGVAFLAKRSDALRAIGGLDEACLQLGLALERSGEIADGKRFA
jgi:hypothetical protein